MTNNIQLITDTSCLYMPSEAEKLGFYVNPLGISIDSQKYYDYESINSKMLMQFIQEGRIPTTSLPSIGRLTEVLEHSPESEKIVLCMADGLSGTYQSAVTAANSLPNADKIHVVNTQTLCGPHRYLVDLTLKLIKENESIQNILNTLKEKIQTTSSFLLPQDFKFLKRGGRLTKLAATLSGLLKVQPIIKQTEDGTRLDRYDIARNFKIAVNKIIQYHKSFLNADYKVYISHADNLEDANYVKNTFLKEFPNVTLEILELSCAFIAQGGPSCIAIQSIKL